MQDVLLDLRRSQAGKAEVSAHSVAGYLRLVWSVPLNICHSYTMSELLLLLALLTQALRALLRHSLELLQKTRGEGRYSATRCPCYKCRKRT